MLPRLDGLEVCRAIRREATTPIVMLTARADTIDVVVGLESGADDYVRKPFEMPELVARVRAALRRHGHEPASGDPAILHLGPLRIDLAGQDGGPRRHRDRPDPHGVRPARGAGPPPGPGLPGDILLDRVWGYDYLGDSRLVDVAVGRLRAKVEADPAAPALVLTVRGAGYKAARRPAETGPTP